MSKLISASCIFLLVLGSTAAQAQAQVIFRTVGPDGAVSFSDKPAAGKDITPTPSASSRLPVDRTTPDGLTFELRQIANRFPVVLYTGDNCSPCTAGRSLLRARGIPYAERTVTTPADADALQRLSGEISLPFLTIGGQHIKGFAEGQWHQFLDAAGYPKTSQLPATYRVGTATPLVAPPAPIVVNAGAQAQNPTAFPPAPSSPALPSRTPDNPAGIRF
jgi:glutaredoxin